MKWSDLRQSSNVEDRRGMGSGVAIGGGGIGILIIALAIYLCGGDPRQFLQDTGTQTQVQQPGAANSAAPQDQNRKFAGAILGSTEDAWTQILPEQAHI